ncbi:uncharacterized protein LOC108708029 [Xenopus laevis]|uniref:Uncharacterized protein LOC108708029 n=2 Tax=Xenopus laevis TaxID=8355 RepID=A0A1L8HDR4_XENLA|nr:uncharacterized protein LOC108708029 [Xenopus laevis]XP_018101775.1 uncharacterized protein LOC108708029 [Xenopus laevis]XP_018101776.1 uncharacterized protein LOC108708029 [Xenopus laevis]XP_018101777.1 uncharacterized protein LOC108708029 [Xenopus laevis]OCT94218.1 hypothetical protein XELAEV_18011886mg [Xenopus laevis]
MPPRKSSTPKSRNSASEPKKKKRAKRSGKSKHVSEEQSARCNSPLVYNPEAIVQELMEKYPKKQQDSGLNELSEYENNRQRDLGLPVRMGLSNKISRFEIPVDIKLLEALTVQDYLRTYCRVCKRRQIYYKKFFDKFDKDRDGILSSQGTEDALKDLYFNEISSSQVKDLMSLIKANEESKIDRMLFSSLCALSERIFYAALVTEDTGVAEKQWLEAADFCGMSWKSSGCHIDDSLKRLLGVLSCTPDGRGV